MNGGNRKAGLTAQTSEAPEVLPASVRKASFSACIGDLSFFSGIKSHLAMCPGVDWDSYKPASS